MEIQNGAVAKSYMTNGLLIYEKYVFAVLLQNGGFFNTCTMKRCLHRKGDFIINALKKAHVMQLLHYKAEKLQNDSIIIYLQIRTNALQMNTSHRKIYLESVFEREKNIVLY
jgi:hypothetical protein